ncbi:MAG: A24 family peptidase [Candidatus Nanohaloarchaea archaeon]|nr:A24 family peptidase [Candidatus Nanohaloarchaea archaeon]
MIGYIILAVVLGGTSTAAYLDLKTTEVPDMISIVVAVAGVLLHAVASYTSGNWSYITRSLLVGAAFFGFGWGLYLLGSWGGADAFVLGSIGFALPYLPTEFQPIFNAFWPFPLTLLFNIFLVGAVYSLLYAAFEGLTSEEVMTDFFKDMKCYWKRLVTITLFFALVVYTLTVYTLSSRPMAYMNSLYPVLGFALALAGVLILYRYLKAVENSAMRKTLESSELEPGEVLAEDVETEEGVIRANRIKGLTEEEVEAIQESCSEITVRYGVRFVPAFPVAVLVSVTFGDLVYWLLVHAL